MCRAVWRTRLVRVVLAPDSYSVLIQVHPTLRPGGGAGLTFDGPPAPQALERQRIWFGSIAPFEGDF